MFLHARQGLNLTRETTHSETTHEPRHVSDAEFRRSLAICGSWQTADYFWTWHREAPHMTLADMHAKIEADKAAAEAAEWEAEQAYYDRLERRDHDHDHDHEAEDCEADPAAWAVAHPDLAAEAALGRVLIAEARARIAEAEETERVALAALEAFMETLTEPEIFTFMEDTIRRTREATAAAAADELAHLEGAGEGGDLDEAREAFGGVIIAIPPRGRPVAPAAAELFASSTSSPTTLLQAEEDDAEEAEWYDQKEWEREDPG